MRSLEFCDWLVIEEHSGNIIGAAGMGGLFHVSSIKVSDSYRGKGIGKELQHEIIKESQRRDYSFVCVFVDPRNIASMNLHTSLGYRRVFRIHYSSGIIQDVMILVLKKRGLILAKILRVCNSLIGIFFLGCVLKIIRYFLPRIISYNEETIPNPSLKHIVKHFEKI